MRDWIKLNTSYGRSGHALSSLGHDEPKSSTAERWIKKSDILAFNVIRYHEEGESKDPHPTYRICMIHGHWEDVDAETFEQVRKEVVGE